MSTYILLSGGIDSYVCAYIKKQAITDISGVFIDYGQPAGEAEQNSATAIATSLNIPLNIITLQSSDSFAEGEIVSRNAFLILSSIMFMNVKSGEFVLGIHSGCPYYDTTELFVSDMQRVLNGYTDGSAILSTPLIKWEKGEIYKFAIRERLDLGLTHSCEADTQPCGRCRSCMDRSALLSMQEDTYK